ncbi:dehydrin DHN1 [Lactuca sativa]|uniref:Dehydrin n=1 Tax=Lactuca sativa TaxID=4236 RepID=A0A9R1W2G1_LACSA|nr:dehydrin DHN1 [Lactuca sativa]KAJ0216253.1 hypothetical protein LSAT_V11C300130890 [Lactuca sativa]
MAEYGDQTYGREGRQTDEYGNPVQKTNEYGNPLHSTTDETMGDYGVTSHQGLGHATGETESYQNQPSATPLSSSNIGIGTGAGYDQHREEGHEKKGVTEKIKEKLPGGHNTDEHSTTTAGGVGGGGYGEGETHEKKGVMEKIKDKLSGH